MRVFVAVPLDRGTDPCAAVLERLHTSSWRPVPPGLRHLTLRFLGEISGAQADLVCEGIRAHCRGWPAMRAELRGLGAFPHWRDPAVLWAGVVGPGRDELARLAACVLEATVSVGEPERRRSFVPHLTLARRRSAAAPARAAAELERLPAPWRTAVWGELRLDTVVVYRSELLAGGPRYTPLLSLGLAETAGEFVP